MNGRGGPKPVSESIERLLGNLNAPSVDVLGQIFHDWASIVGADVAEHTRPVAINGDLLTVSATDPTWATEFRWLESEVVKRLETVTGSGRIQRLSVRVGKRG